MSRHSDGSPPPSGPIFFHSSWTPKNYPLIADCTRRIYSKNSCAAWRTRWGRRAQDSWRRTIRWWWDWRSRSTARRFPSRRWSVHRHDRPPTSVRKLYVFFDFFSDFKTFFEMTCQKVVEISKSLVINPSKWVHILRSVIAVIQFPAPGVWSILSDCWISMSWPIEMLA